MITSSIRRISALKLISNDLIHLGKVQFWKRRCFHSVAGAASALSLDTTHVDDDSDILCVRSCVIGCVSEDRILHARESAVLYREVVWVFRTLDWSVARKIEFCEVVRRFGVSHAVDVFRIIVHVFAMVGMRMEVFCLLRCVIGYCREVDHDRRDLDTMKLDELLEDMENHGKNPTVVTYGVYIDGLCKAGYVDNAIRLWRSQNQHLNVYYYNALMKGFCQQGKIHEAERLFYNMQAHGVLPDIYSYNILIDGLCKNDDIEKGVIFLKGMERCGLKPTVESYTSLIGGWCKKGQLDLSLQMFGFLKTSGYEIDKPFYDVLIKGFCKNGDMDYASKLFHEMICLALMPDVYSFNNLIHGFCKVGLLDQALECFHVMAESGFLPGRTICNVILQGYCKNDRLEKALEIMYEMWSKGLGPNLFSYNIVIDRICKELSPRTAWELFSLMLKMSVSPNVVTYSSIIDGYAKSGSIKKARMLHAKMLKLGVAEDVVMRTILINMFSSIDRVRKAYQIFKDMRSGGLTVDRMCYTSIIAAFCGLGNMKLALKLFHDMKNTRNFPGVFTYNCLIDGFSKVKRMDEAHRLLDEMLRNGITPNEVTYTIFIVGYRRLGKPERVQEFEKLRGQVLCPEAAACMTLGLDSSLVDYGTEFVSVPCRHLFLYMKTYAEMHVKGGTANRVLCSRTKCGGMVPPFILRRLLGDEEFDCWESLIQQKMLDSMPDVSYCSKCETACIEGEENLAQCSKFYFSFCTFCRDKCHVGEECMSAGEKLLILRDSAKLGDEQERKEQELINGLMCQKEIFRDAKQCPSYKMAISCTEGCKEMVCGNCGQYFYYSNIAVAKQLMDITSDLVAKMSKGFCISLEHEKDDKSRLAAFDGFEFLESQDSNVETYSQRDEEETSHVII
ncbi:Pentatricopeptide repeat-containing protein [Drosera capensis]